MIFKLLASLLPLILYISLSTSSNLIYSGTTNTYLGKLANSRISVGGIPVVHILFPLFDILWSLDLKLNLTH